jgi:hypothetical protein
VGEGRVVVALAQTPASKFALLDMTFVEENEHFHQDAERMLPLILAN